MKMINQEIIDFANSLADLSGEIARKYFRQNLYETNKDNDSPVTKADQEIESTLRDAISKKFPAHGIIGEEYGVHNEQAELKWVIDPIDGTTSFIIGRPIFGTLIALTYQNQSILGVIDQPITRERWLGVTGDSTKFNGKIIRTKNCTEISQAILCTTSSFFFQGRDLQIFNAVSSKTKYQKHGGAIYGGDCYLFGLLALGSVDIIIERGLNNYDFAALVPVVEAAGGIITDWHGEKLHLDSDGTVVACGDKILYEKVLQQMQSVKFND